MIPWPSTVEEWRARARRCREIAAAAREIDCAPAARVLDGEATNAEYLADRMEAIKAPDVLAVRD